MPTHKYHHQDSAKKRGVDLLNNAPEGSRWFHPKTGHVYEVTGLSFYAESGRWMVNYRREDPGESDPIVYSHFPEDFHREGRFLRINK